MIGETSPGFNIKAQFKFNTNAVSACERASHKLVVNYIVKSLNLLVRRARIVVFEIYNMRFLFLSFVRSFICVFGVIQLASGWCLDKETRLNFTEHRLFVGVRQTHTRTQNENEIHFSLYLFQSQDDGVR